MSFPRDLPLDLGDKTATSHAEWLRDLADYLEALGDSFSEHVSNTDLVARWLFNAATGTTIRDTSAEGNNGTLTAGSGAWSKKGPFGRSYYFNGSVVNCGDDDSLTDIGEQTYTAWIYLTAWGDDNTGCIFSKNGAAGFVSRLCVDGANGAISFGRRFSSAHGTWRTPASSIGLNAWYHIAVVYDHSDANNDPTIYINGQPASVTETSTPSGTASEYDEDFLVGDSYAGDKGFEGFICDLRKYSTSLTQDEIQAMYMQPAHDRPVILSGASATPTISNGASNPEVVEVGASNYTPVWCSAFATGVDTGVFWNLPLPADYSGESFAVTFYWLERSGNTGNVVWEIAGRAFANDEALDQALGAALTVTDGVTAQHDLMSALCATQLVLAGTPAGAEFAVLRVRRLGTDGGDTLSGDAYLLGVKLEY